METPSWRLTEASYDEVWTMQVTRLACRPDTVTTPKLYRFPKDQSLPRKEATLRWVTFTVTPSSPIRRTSERLCSFAGSIR